MADNDESSPFDNISNELLMRILSFVDVKNRIRLESLCTRFRNCISKAPAWVRDQHLEMCADSDRINGSNIPKNNWCRIVRKILSITKITAISLYYADPIDNGGFLNPKRLWLQTILVQFYGNLKGIRLRKLLIFDQKVYGLAQFVHWCLINNSESLEQISIDLQSDQLDNSNASLDVAIMINTLITCQSLREVAIGGRRLVLMSSVLAAILNGKCVTELNLHDCYLPTDKVADVCNEIEENSLKSLTLHNIKGMVLKDLIDLLLPSVCNNLTKLSFAAPPDTAGADPELMQILPKLPSIFPKVQELFISATNMAYTAVEVFGNLSKFLQECDKSEMEKCLTITLKVSPTALLQIKGMFDREKDSTFTVDCLGNLWKISSNLSYIVVIWTLDV